MFGQTRKDELRNYESDVYYEVWRSGRDPDRIDYGRVEDNFYRGCGPHEAARVELSEQYRRDERLREARAEEAFYEELERRRIEENA